MDRTWKSIGTDSLKNGGWVCYMAEYADERDIMSDVVRPQWGKTGRYEIYVMKPGKHNSSDASIQIAVDSKAGNWIAHLIRKGIMSSYQELAQYLENFCKKVGTYRKGYNIVEWYGELTYELSQQMGG